MSSHLLLLMHQAWYGAPDAAMHRTRYDVCPGGGHPAVGRVKETAKWGMLPHDVAILH